MAKGHPQKPHHHNLILPYAPIFQMETLSQSLCTAGLEALSASTLAWKLLAFVGYPGPGRTVVAHFWDGLLGTCRGIQCSTLGLQRCQSASSFFTENPELLLEMLKCARRIHPGFWLVLKISASAFFLFNLPLLCRNLPLPFPLWACLL